jgi:hypothetical protein
MRTALMLLLKIPNMAYINTKSPKRAMFLICMENIMNKYIIYNIVQNASIQLGKKLTYVIYAATTNDGSIPTIYYTLLFRKI